MEQSAQAKNESSGLPCCVSMVTLIAPLMLDQGQTSLFRPGSKRQVVTFFATHPTSHHTLGCQNIDLNYNARMAGS